MTALDLTLADPAPLGKRTRLECRRLVKFLANLRKTCIEGFTPAAAAQCNSEYCDVRDEIQFAVNIARSIQPTHRVQFRIPPASCRLLVDVVRLDNILLNYVSNAVKNAESTVDVTCAVESSVVRIEVHDDGDGVAPAFVPSLFKFRKKQQTRSGGLGIGLYSVATEARRMGGACGYAVSPRLGGALFWLTFPYTPAVSPVPPTGVSPVLAVKEGEPGVSILLVDDAPIILKLTRRQLLRGVSRVATVDVALDGYDALQKLAAHPYTLLITDLQMPGMDGFELIRKVRCSATAVDPRIPAYIHSANDSEEDRLRGVDSGATGFFTKPMDIRLVNQTIKRMLAPICL